jgi:hypothetical protein
MPEPSPEQRRSDYLARAEEARQLAASAIDPQARQSLSQVAQGWETLAQRLTASHLNPLLRHRHPAGGTPRHP